jgi:hypothetical protein
MSWRDDEDEWTEIRVRVKRTTDMALLCHYEGDDVWIAKSQVDFDISDVSEEGDVGTLVVKTWLLREKGLV